MCDTHAHTSHLRRVLQVQATHTHDRTVPVGVEVLAWSTGDVERHTHFKVGVGERAHSDHGGARPAVARPAVRGERTEKPVVAVYCRQCVRLSCRVVHRVRVCRDRVGGGGLPDAERRRWQGSSST